MIRFSEKTRTSQPWNRLVRSDTSLRRTCHSLATGSPTLAGAVPPSADCQAAAGPGPGANVEPLNEKSAHQRAVAKQPPASDTPTLSALCPRGVDAWCPAEASSRRPAEDIRGRGEGRDAAGYFWSDRSLTLAANRWVYLSVWLISTHRYRGECVRCVCVCVTDHTPPLSRCRCR